MLKAAFFAAAAAANSAGAALYFMCKRTSPSPKSPYFYDIHVRLARAARAGLSLLLPSPLVDDINLHEHAVETQEGFEGIEAELKPQEASVTAVVEVSQESFDGAGESKAEEEEEEELELEVVEDGEEGAEGGEPVKASGREECLDGTRDLQAEEKAEEEEAREDVIDEGEEVVEVGDLVEVSVQDLLTVEVEGGAEEHKVELLAVQEEEGDVEVLIQEEEEEDKGDVLVLIQEEKAQEDVSDESEEVVEGGDLVEVSVQDLLTVEVEGGAVDHKLELLAVQEEEGDVKVLIQEEEEEEEDKGDVMLLIQEEDEGDCKVFVQEELERDVDDPSSSEIIASVEAEGGAQELVDGGDDVQPAVSSVSAVTSEPSRIHVPFMMFGSIPTTIHPTGLLPSIVVGTVPIPLRPPRTMPFTIWKNSIAQPSSSIRYWNEIIAASSHRQESLTPSSLDKLEHKVGYDSYPATYSGRELCGNQHSRAA